MPVWTNTSRANVNQDGFTLIEVLVAIVILSIGIMALSAMQTVAIQGNATANRITDFSNWASDRAEQVFAMQYVDNDNTCDNDEITDANDNGLAGLDDSESPDCGPVTKGNYSIVWNVAEDEPMPDTKTIHVIVTRSDQDSSKRATFEYIKMKYMK